MHWRVIVDARPRTGAENMAVDHALLERVQAGDGPYLRLYRWDPPCLSLGRNQPVAGLEVAAAAAARGIDVVRRPTGGLAVYHDREVTYAVAVPVGVLGSPRATYRAINRALVAGLRRLGVPADVAAPARAGRRGGADWAAPCFDAAAPGEVVVGGRKLVGSAQRAERRTLLQHGSLLLAGDQREAAELLGATRGRAGDVAAGGVTSLAAVLGRVPPWDVVAAAVRGGFEDALGIRLEEAAPDRALDARVRALTARYRSGDWTWRR
ncbi:MAG TPA: lipoate--protein ligase family protein [Longimicrobiales bacterium]